MRRLVVSLGALLFIFGCLVACSESTPVAIDPAAIDAQLTTNPDKPAAGMPIRLLAEFTGAELSSSSGMTFEVRVDEEPMLQEAKKEGGNSFSGEYTFPDPGTYEVYLHLYTDDIHLTKKKQVEVQ